MGVRDGFEAHVGLPRCLALGIALDPGLLLFGLVVPLGQVRRGAPTSTPAEGDEVSLERATGAGAVSLPVGCWPFPGPHIGRGVTTYLGSQPQLP